MQQQELEVTQSHHLAFHQALLLERQSLAVALLLLLAAVLAAVR
jgi:hypothetical protein